MFIVFLCVPGLESLVIFQEHLWIIDSQPNLIHLSLPSLSWFILLSFSKKTESLKQLKVFSLEILSHCNKKNFRPISWNSRKINNVWAPAWQSKHFHCFPLDSFTFSFPGFVNFMFFNRLDKNHISIEILIELWTLNKIKHKIIWKLPNFQMINL